MIEPTRQEVMDLFPHLYEGYKTRVTKPVELDNELGLEVVQKESLWTKYDIEEPNQKNSFIESLEEQFEARGRLSDKQVACIRNPRY